MKNIVDTSINGLKVFETKKFNDPRGSFVKIYQREWLEQSIGDNSIEECFISSSNKNVIRGMHFQTPPFDHHKIVFVLSGKILDVIIDLRKKSKTYGKYFSIELTGESGRALFIPKGMGHGFLSRENNSTVGYLTTKSYRPENDRGILWSSFGMEWGTKYPSISDRDKGFPSLDNFDSPF